MASVRLNTPGGELGGKEPLFPQSRPARQNSPTVGRQVQESQFLGAGMNRPLRCPLGLAVAGGSRKCESRPQSVNFRKAS